MLHNKIITKDDVTQTEFERAKAVRNAIGYAIKDEELLDFYVEWNNAVYMIKNPTKKRR